MTHEEERNVKGQILLELRETSQALEVRREKLKAMGNTLEAVGRRFGAGKAEIGESEEAVFDLPSLKALIAELNGLAKKKQELEDRVRAIGL
jgi:outer membrane protein TolC